MSLPLFSTQAELFSTAGLSASLFAPSDRYRLFARLVFPKLAAARSTLEACYCADNGRIALEPVLMLGVSILQEVDGVPDRQAVEMLRYHAGWNFALNRQLGDAVFHPTSLVNFRHRLEEHQQSALAFRTILRALQEAGLVSRQSQQRLDSTQMFGRVAKMSRLDCVRESLRLALQELEADFPTEQRPVFWADLWERYVESQVDYRATLETLGRKLGEAGCDSWKLLEWLREPGPSGRAPGAQTRLLERVFGEQFEVQAGQTAPQAREKERVAAGGTTESSPPEQAVMSAGVADPAPATPAEPSSCSEAGSATAPVPSGQTEFAAETLSRPAQVQPKGRGQLDSDRVQNPHEPDATYGVKGEGAQKKEHIGYKVQIAESVSPELLAAGEPTRNFITGIVTQGAHESDQAGAAQMEEEQAEMGLEKPPVLYVDAAYISAQKLAQAQAEGRELIGPASAVARKNGRFSTEDFQINVEARTALCPAGKTNTRCGRLEERTTGQVSYRFEFSTHCHACPLRGQCVAPDQPHRILLVGEHHTALQTRRQEQHTEAFQQRMKHRNGIEGTQSELVRGHGMRRARYRGLGKVKLQNYLIGAACNVKRWIRREAWKMSQAAALSAPVN
jgi:hypothetical protein